MTDLDLQAELHALVTKALDQNVAPPDVVMALFFTAACLTSSPLYSGPPGAVSMIAAFAAVKQSREEGKSTKLDEVLGRRVTVN